ncbi:MAG: D-aminoacyl-tRNA deacylase, partial [Legionellales bacterium]|nr:D-aminoacyl-tRNA deacylase [Legionellales bacterium]
HSKLLFDYLVNHAKQIYTGIKIGKFGANMQIELCNNGPVSFMLEN